METVFLKLLNMSITATWLVLAVIVLRLLFKKAPKSIMFIMWAFVGIRLIIPFSFESVLSLIPSAETIPSDITYSSMPIIESGIPIINFSVNPVISQALAPDPSSSVNPMQIITFTASVIWLVGMIVMLIYTIVSYIKINSKVREAMLSEDGIWLCDRINTPFIFGIIKPRIFLPSNIKETDMGYVIAHEKAHLKRHDHWWKPLAFLLLTIYWFNPVLWAAYILLCRDIELACDEKVIKELGTEIKKPYSEALLNCSVSRKSILACPLAFGEVGVKKRIKTVLSYKKPSFWIIIIALVASVVLAVCFLTNPKKVELSETDPELDTAVSQAILEINSDYMRFGECMSEGHIIYGVEEYGSKTKVYLYELFYTFGFEDGYFMSQSGHSVPAVFVFNKNEDGYTFLKSEYPEDGEGYGDSVRMMFPSKYVNRVLLPTMNDEKKLWKQCEAYAEQYLKEIGREAEICTYGDIDHILFTDLGVSVDVSNKISNMGLPYKSEIGNFEEVEGGVRYVYTTSFLQDKNIILFTKEIYDSKEIVEKIEVDSLTGIILTASSQPEESKYFDAKILEVSGDNVLVEPFEGSTESNSSSQIWVSTKTSSSVPPPDLYEGLYIRIVYDGMIQETYPAQINNVYAIYLYADVNYTGEKAPKREHTTKAYYIEE